MREKTQSDNVIILDDRNIDEECKHTIWKKQISTNDKQGDTMEDTELYMADDWHLTKDVFLRLNTDLREAAKLISRQEAKFLVDLYYGIQKFRVQSQGQIRSAEDEPTNVLSWVKGNVHTLENDIKIALGFFASKYAVGQWLQGICGIGPVLSAGFLATLDIRDKPTAGHWWRFAGIDPTLDWVSSDRAKALVKKVVGDSKTVEERHIAICADQINRRPEQIKKAHLFLSKDKVVKMTPDKLAKAIAVRPWNARLKTLCFKAGECFIKVQNNDKDVYGHIYAKRRAYEEERNEQGLYKEQADIAAKRVGKSTDAYKSYSVGKLPPGHLLARARRYAVKMFLSHYHAVCYKNYYNEEPPVPYVFVHCDGDHRHFIPPPEVKTDGLSLRDLFGES
jgi:hypothetical protein